MPEISESRTASFRKHERFATRSHHLLAAADTLAQQANRGAPAAAIPALPIGMHACLLAICF